MKTKRYISPKQFAEILSISRWTVYAMAYDGRIRTVKLGRLLRIPESEVRRLTKQ